MGDILTKEPFDWNKAIDAMVAGDPFNKYNYEELEDKACLWVTCAVGNQCNIIPRYSGGAPIDNKLHHLGNVFAEQVSGSNWREAKKTLNKIERRSATVIRHIAKKKGLEVNF